MKRQFPDLRTYMRKTGATQADIAKAAGTVQPVISRILRGRQRPSLDLALRIAKAANIPVESLNTEQVA